MRAIGVGELRDDPNRVLRAARMAPVLITSDDHPEALLLSVRGLGADEADIRSGLASVLFEQGALSLGRAARVAGLPLEQFMEYLGRRGIAVFRTSVDELEADLRVLGL